MLTLTLLQYLDANFNYRALSTLIFIILCNDVVPNNKNQIFLQDVQPLDNQSLRARTGSPYVWSNLFATS